MEREEAVNSAAIKRFLASLSVSLVLVSKSVRALFIGKCLSYDVATALYDNYKK